MNPDPAVHPSRETWLDFLYDELPPAERRRLADHLETCPACEAELARWRQTTTALDAWELPGGRRSRPQFAASLKWAAAAALVLFAGVAAGRLTAPQIDPAKLRAELVPALRQELRHEFQKDLQTAVAAADARTQRQFNEFATAWSAARQEDQQTTLSLFNRADTDRKADYTRLRRDLETVAIHAEVRLDTTEQALDELASVAPPVGKASHR